MLKLFFITLSGLTAVHSADHDTFKDCSRIDFCNQLRNRPPFEDYVIDPARVSFGTDFNAISAILQSTTGNVDLNLTLFGLEKNTFRLKITEAESSSRYELKDVLDGEPKPLSFVDMRFEDRSFIVKTSEGDSVVISFAPFRVEFAKDGVSQVVFNGDRLTMRQDPEVAPFSFGVTFPQAVQLFGLHEHCQHLALSTTIANRDPLHLKNTDLAYFEIDSPMALYGSVPVLYGFGPSSTAGVFLHNAAELWIDIDNENGQGYFMAETGSLDLFILLGPTLKDVVRQYTSLTGTAHLQQLWTLGYHHSRFGYTDQDDVVNIVYKFVENDFPLDAIWLDVDYSRSYRYFAWNAKTFPEPLVMQEAIANVSKKVVPVINPHIKIEHGSSFYDGALEGGFFVKNSNGSAFEGSCFPKNSSWMDFLNPDARQYYADMFQYKKFKNSTTTIAGIWNNMNEPSVWDNSLQMTLPPDTLQYGNVTHREVHNIYGLLHTASTHQGLIKRDGGKIRPFILTRSHFSGSQRYAAITTGESTAAWPFLRASYPACLNANLLGLVFCGADVGGYYGSPTDELLERWYQSGAWLPLFRAHAYKDTARREPYLKNEQVQDVIRTAIQTRYKHLPVWYTLFYEHTRSGDPIVRPLFYHYPQEDVLKIDDHLLVGSDILVRPVMEYDIYHVEVYFPGGKETIWVSEGTDKVYAGTGLLKIPVDIKSVPVFYKRGTVIVRKEILRLNTVEMAEDPYVLYYTLDENNSAHGTMYRDDGLSFKYRDSFDYNYVSIDINGNEIVFSSIDKEAKGHYDFKISSIVNREIVSLPSEGKAGTYKETVHTEDAEGSLLEDILIDPRKKTVLKLK